MNNRNPDVIIVAASPLDVRTHRSAFGFKTNLIKNVQLLQPGSHEKSGTTAPFRGEHKQSEGEKLFFVFGANNVEKCRPLDRSASMLVGAGRCLDGWCDKRKLIWNRAPENSFCWDFTSHRDILLRRTRRLRIYNKMMIY